MKENDNEKVLHIPLSQLYTPQIHPFQIREDKAMLELAESIQQQGVLLPGIARPLESGGYELVSGNRRKRASELAGRDAMPVIVREMDDDAAMILLVDANLQRESLLPSEKAFAYRLKLEAIKRQGKRNDLTSTPLAPKLSVERIGEEYRESREQVRRYIRLTELLPVLLQMVDEKKLAFRPAVELSYLRKREQQLLLEVIEKNEVFPSLKQAQVLRSCSTGGWLDEDSIAKVLLQEKIHEHKITLDGKWVQERFPKEMTRKQIKVRIEQALDLLEKAERKKKLKKER